MDFVEVDIQCQEDLKEILAAELWQLGYESFMDTSTGFKAYRPAGDYDPELLNLLGKKYAHRMNYSCKNLPEENWNENWEKNFAPLMVDDQCLVRASFHPPNPAIPYEIIIDPKMSFGTGHHETTRLMIRRQLELDHKHKAVLDVGCGTGILSILAEKRGAETVLALDIDPWAVDNSVQNAALNQCQRIRIVQGTIQQVPRNEPYHLILANINRNVLLQEIPRYVDSLYPQGTLIISGFYIEDQPQIVKKCESVGLDLESHDTENNWACLSMKLKSPEVT